MTAITYSSAREQFAKTIDTAINDHVPVLITRRSGGNAVLISEEDFKSYEETAYLMQSTTNAMRLNNAIESLRNGRGFEKELLPA